MVSDPETRSHAVATYKRTHQQYVGGARKLEALISELIGEEEDINYLSVDARAKDPASFEAKACRPHPDDPSRPKYDDPLREITDLVAARVITYLAEAVERVCEVIEREFEIVEHTDMGADVKARGGFGYASRHFLVRLDAARSELPEYDVLLIELADNEFTAIDTMYRGLIAEQSGASGTLTADTLTNYLTRRYPDAPHARTANYTWMLGTLRTLGVTTEHELTALLGDVDSAAVQDAMNHRFPAGMVRRLDDDLLAVLGEDYLVVFPDEERRLRILRGRLKALARAGIHPA